MERKVNRTIIKGPKLHTLMWLDLLTVDALLPVWLLARPPIADNYSQLPFPRTYIRAGTRARSPQSPPLPTPPPRWRHEPPWHLARLPVSGHADDDEIGEFTSLVKLARLQAGLAVSTLIYLLLSPAAAAAASITARKQNSLCLN